MTTEAEMTLGYRLKELQRLQEHLEQRMYLLEQDYSALPSRHATLVRKLQRHIQFHTEPVETLTRARSSANASLSGP